jgi:ABC-type transport system substrate-binding protein
VIYPDGEAERQGGTVTKAVGTGPFEFVEWKKDSVIRKGSRATPWMTGHLRIHGET